MNLRFTKMHGLGNDFMVIDGIRQTLPETGLPLPADEIRRLGDRNFGVGFDQMLIVQPSRSADADFRYRILNADGSEVSRHAMVGTINRVAEMIGEFLINQHGGTRFG